MADRKAPYEVLERVAVTSCLLADAVDSGGPVPPTLLQDRLDAMMAYRAAVRPLRTEAEVALDIGRHVRACVRLGQVKMTASEKAQLETLANEQTADDPFGEPFACCCGAAFPTSSERAVHWETCARFLGKEPEPAPELADPAPCSCEVLLAQLQRIRALAEPAAKSASSIPTRAERALHEILEVLG